MRIAGRSGERVTSRIRVYKVLVASALIVSALLFVAVAWQDRRGLLREAGEDAVRTAAIFQQHALSVLETHALVAKRIDERLQGLSWDEIGRSEDVHRYLHTIQQTFPQVEALWLVDPSGTVRNTSAELPEAPVSVADRADFLALRAGSGDGTPTDYLARDRVVPVGATFDLVRRRMSAVPGGVRFDGLIVVSVNPDYFNGFWREAMQSRDISAALVRDDGTVLAGEPAATPGLAGFLPDPPMLRALGNAREGLSRARSLTDGVERLYAFRKVGDYPAFVVYGVNVGIALRHWRDDLAAYGIIFGITALALVLMVMPATRHAREEEAAVRLWREAALRADAEAEARIAAEQQLHQAQKMEALGRLTGGVAHDFNNLLTVIIGNLEMLRGRQRNGRDEKKVDAALIAAEHGARAVQSLLAFARRQPLRAEVFDLNTALLGMEDLLRQSVGANIALRLDLAPDTWPVEIDVSQTGLALLNLAVNARDAMPRGGTLRLRTGNTKLRSDEAGVEREYVALAVTDTGTGMPPDVVRRSFEPFFTTKEPGRGTGLGLSQVYGFVKQSGGMVTIDSDVGRGTTVTLYLPRAAAAAREGGCAAKRRPEPGRTIVGPVLAEMV